jgi:hypothetical protein
MCEAEAMLAGLNELEKAMLTQHEANTARRDYPETVKTYLGDSVYVHFDGWMLTLETNNGFGPSNTIHLEPEVYAALVEFVDRLKKESTP